ncbi:MAG: hypothetical protein IJ365_04210 [Clostridia bacterium]|nr:hypothetical protein [Clostridia bacterium]
MKKYSFLKWAAVVYLFVCFVDIFFYKITIISHYGFREYSILENGVLYTLVFMSVLVSTLALKRNRFKRFFTDSVIFWLGCWVLSNLINIPFWVSLYVEGYETFAFEVNFFSQDIWFFHYVGYFIGTIIAGVISLYKQLNLNRSLDG